MAEPGKGLCALAHLGSGRSGGGGKRRQRSLHGRDASRTEDRGRPVLNRAEVQ